MTETLNLNLQLVTDAVEQALANFLGEDPTDDQVELVTDRVLTGLRQLADGASYSVLTTYLESSSTYVQTDLDELEMADYVGVLETQLEDYGVL
jgi:hypothetical protein